MSEKTGLVAVTSRSFSTHPLLRQQLQKEYINVKFNESNEQLTGEKLVNFLQGAEKAIIGLELIDEILLAKLPDLKVICKMGTGIDKIDFKALNQYNVAFTHTPGVNKRSVSELVLALVFTLLRHLPAINANVKKDKWRQLRGTTLTGKVVGIIGFGAIGRDLAELLKGFNCQCLIYDVIEHNNLPSHVTQINLEKLLMNSDIVTLHVPLTLNNYHFIDKPQLSKMKKGSILINTARGGLINEEALYEFLQHNYLQAAALDVFETEPKVPLKLLQLDNFFATSHIAGSTEEAILAMGLQAIEGLKVATIPKIENYA